MVLNRGNVRGNMVTDCGLAPLHLHRQLFLVPASEAANDDLNEKQPVDTTKIPLMHEWHGMLRMSPEERERISKKTRNLL
ncbi:hypothetical protein quinque_008697 [Culex quinquefasciatus]